MSELARNSYVSVSTISDEQMDKLLKMCKLTSGAMLAFKKKLAELQGSASSQVNRDTEVTAEHVRVQMQGCDGQAGEGSATQPPHVLQSMAQGTTAAVKGITGLGVPDAVTFATSNFNAFYKDTPVPGYQHELFKAVYELLLVYCRLTNLERPVAEAFFQTLQRQAFKKAEELLDEVPAVAQRLWTSTEVMALAPLEHRRELSFIINSLLRSDHREAAPFLAVIARGVNTLLITRRTDAHEIISPPNGVVYRGGGLSDQHRQFYHVGKKYRVPGFLATSFSQEVAESFMTWADRRGEPCVLWIVHVVPEGESSNARKCMHVNYVTRSEAENEQEYLFAPYAPFTVREVREGLGIPSKPHVIILDAGLDSRDYEEYPATLPLAPWS